MPGPDSKGKQWRKELERLRPLIPEADEELDFIYDTASQAAYWAGMAAEGARIGDPTLILYATRKATAFLRAFANVVKDKYAPVSAAEREPGDAKK
jgi:hypothetical protein